MLKAFLPSNKMSGGLSRECFMQLKLQTRSDACQQDLNGDWSAYTIIGGAVTILDSAEE